MKKQINQRTNAYFIRGAIYLLLLIGVCAIPFALASLSSVRTGETAPADTTCSGYTTSTSTDTIVPGDTDTGNHTDDGTTPITFPFPVSLYGSTFTSAIVSSNGSLQFTGDSDSPFAFCLPDPAIDEAILPYQGDLITDQSAAGCSSFSSGCGVFTSVTGTAPNRVFNIEWRAGFFGRPGTANFEVRFSEANPSCFDIIYGVTVDSGMSEESGVQQSGAGPFTEFSCELAALTNGLKVTYCCQSSPSPTPTPPIPIALTANGYKVKGFDTVDLLWTGAASANFDIKRNGTLIATGLPSTASPYRDSTGKKGPNTFIYQVCETGGGNCSPQVTVRFGGG
jgi:hypothetical protein